MKKIAFFVVIAGLSSIALTLWIKSLVQYQSPRAATIFFERGSSLRHMSQRLDDEEVVPQARFFEWMARVFSDYRRIKAGEYEFQKGITPWEVLETLLTGKVKLYPLTIPEGFDLIQIGRRIAERGTATEEEWTIKIKDREWIRTMGIDASSLEGYLFPETYLLERTTTLDQLVAQMVALFNQKVAHDIQAVRERGLTLHEWVTLASIIERESAVAFERPLIASVFLNRIKRGIPLQSDPTVIYGIVAFDGNLTRAHLETDHPYNTYTRAGLPPGPICSPGLDSLKAVVDSNPTDYLYFVSKGDGGHHFSRSLDEHNRAVDFFQLGQGKAPTHD